MQINFVRFGKRKEKKERKKDQLLIFFLTRIPKDIEQLGLPNESTTTRPFDIAFMKRVDNIFSLSLKLTN